MTVYVDEIRQYGSGSWCHMMTNGPIEELHAMADAIGLKRNWFQNNPDHPHYDLRISKRTMALANGATACSSLEMIQMIREKRAEKPNKIAEQ